MKIFVTGGSGYIGGTLAERLIEAGHQVSGLVRSEERAAAIRARGMTPVLGDLDNADVLANAAKGADAIFHTAHADHEASVKAILDALAGSEKFFLHTSGAGIVADMAGGEERAPVYDETTPVTPLPVRAPRLALINAIRDFARNKVRTVVVAPPMIYGKGKGVNPNSIQIPKMIAVARETGVAQCVGPGTNRWSCVHVQDLVELYVAALAKAPAGAFYYADNGTVNSMHDIATSISRMLGLGSAVKSLSIPEAYAVYGEGPVNLSFGSNCRVRAVRPRQELGWAPRQRPLLDEIEHGSYSA
jgi:nucleoside-diphosphate-sugar epimerase